MFIMEKMDPVKNNYSDKTAQFVEMGLIEREATKTRAPFSFSFPWGRTPIEREETKSRPNRLNQIIFLAALVITLNAFFNTSESNEMLKIGDHIPPFTLKLTNGQKIANADFQNKPAMYFFYASWCPCSHQSMEWIKMALNNNSSTALSILGIGIQDSQKKLEEFANLHQLTFPVSTVGGNAVANSIGVKTTPTTIFADSNGIIRWIFVGKIERYDQLQDGLQRILSPPETAATT